MYADWWIIAFSVHSWNYYGIVVQVNETKKKKKHVWITTGFDTISDMTKNKRVTALWPRDIVSLDYYYEYIFNARVREWSFWKLHFDKSNLFM